MKKLIKSIAVMLTFVFASLAAHAGEWPATADALMSTKKITIRLSQYAQIVLEDNSYKLYRYTVRQATCRTQAISGVVKISDNVVEYYTQKEGLCDAKILRFSIAEKQFDLLLYEGERSQVKEELRAESVIFN